MLPADRPNPRADFDARRALRDAQYAVRRAYAAIAASDTQENADRLADAWAIHDNLLYDAGHRAAVPDTQRDAARYRALRPFLSADATGDGKRWALWCVLHKGEEEEVAIQIHARRPASDAEQARRDSGDPEWGPSADEMVDEMVAAAREVP